MNPAGSAYFDARARDYAGRLAPYHEAVARIRKRFAGTPVGATESIFVPMARATGLNLISPPGLMNAVAEDANPSVEDVALFQEQIKEEKIKVLVYNNQTNSTLTSQLRDMAKEAAVPVVGVSETLAPVDATFEDWQTSTTQGAGRCTCFINRAVRRTQYRSPTRPFPREGQEIPAPGGRVGVGPPVVAFRNAAAALGGRTIWEHATFRDPARRNSSPWSGRTGAARARSFG